MTRQLFGTDGIRARFGEEPLTRETVRRLGLALGRKLRGTADGEPPLVLLGGDTRASTPLLVEWMTAGLQAAGARTVDLGVLPTPAVAWSVPRSGAAAGVVASASHNPAEDNGLKLIDGAGFKWSTEAESRLEGLLAATESPASSDRQAAGRPTSGATDLQASRRYLRWLVGEAGGRRALAGMRVALDAANGAAATIAGGLSASAPESSSSSPLRMGRTSTATAARPTRRRLPLGSRPASSTSGSPSTVTPTARCCSTNEGRFTTATRCSICGPATSTSEASWSCPRSSPPA